MILKAFSLLDTKTGAYSPPFFMAHVGQAVRACMDLGQDLNTSVGRHPADYALVELGTFDDNSGMLIANNFEHHGTVLGFLPRPQQLPLDGALSISRKTAPVMGEPVDHLGGEA